MRGSIFVEFMDHLEQRYGLENVDAVISDLGESLPTAAAYTGVGDYPHEELLAIAQGICSTTDTELETLIHEFAKYLIVAFKRMHPAYFERAGDVFEFLESIESIIHRDVRRLYPHSRPPLITIERLEDGSRKLIYESHRPLAPLALSLAEVSAAMFDQSLAIEILDQPDDGRRLTLLLKRS